MQVMQRTVCTLRKRPLPDSASVPDRASESPPSRRPPSLVAVLVALSWRCLLAFKLVQKFTVSALLTVVRELRG